MNKFPYRGSAFHEDGRKVPLLLKEGKCHWIDNDRNRWRKSDGVLACVEGRWPRLSLRSIHMAPHAVPNNSRRLTHEGRVTMYVGGGVGALYKLRETKLYWIDSCGNKYLKDGGWGRTDESMRLLLHTVTPLTQTQIGTVSVQTSRAK